VRQGQAFTYDATVAMMHADASVIMYVMLHIEWLKPWVGKGTSSAGAVHDSTVCTSNAGAVCHSTGCSRGRNSPSVRYIGRPSSAKIAACLVIV
jgi:hypothetical protein